MIKGYFEMFDLKQCGSLHACSDNKPVGRDM
jgi:hypothetical protein